VDDATPFVAPHGGLGHRLLVGGAKVALRATLLVSPRPTVWLLRRAFAAGGAATARGLEAHRPKGVVALVDEPYGDEPDTVLDVFRPAASKETLPTVVWVHGGGFIGGSKVELRGWCSLIASKGYAVVAPRYSLAPERRYPTPVRQLMQVFPYLDANRARLGLDPRRVVVGGDSAGAQLAAQTAALATTPGYAEVVGVTPTTDPDRLRGVVLACGPFDLRLLDDTGVVRAVGWAYSGRRRYLDDPLFATMSVADHLSPAFPPALVTVGNADPLRPHSELLVERLRALGVEPETLFFPADHAPPLGHEYQFDLDSDAGGLFLARMLAFLDRRLNAVT
jgi:acetyl esterase/lipase